MYAAWTQNFHDVTIVDMDEEREPKVTAADLTHLRDSWPPGIFNHMKWFQQDLEVNEKGGQARVYAGTTDAVQILWKGDSLQYVPSRGQTSSGSGTVVEVSGSWCTVWRGSPQDCMEHLRNGHDVPGISKTASIERFVPPWTVRREVWTESMRLEHSGISTDILLFSELGVVADTPLQGLPRRAATRRLSIRLHDEAPCPLADATKYDGGTNVGTGNRTRGDTQICKAFPTGCA